VNESKKAMDVAPMALDPVAGEGYTPPVRQRADVGQATAAAAALIARAALAEIRLWLAAYNISSAPCIVSNWLPQHAEKVNSFMRCQDATGTRPWTALAVTLDKYANLYFMKNAILVKNTLPVDSNMVKYRSARGKLGSAMLTGANKRHSTQIHGVSDKFDW
jgi:hypothetical protein